MNRERIGKLLTAKDLGANSSGQAASRMADFRPFGPMAEWLRRGLQIRFPARISARVSAFPVLFTPPAFKGLGGGVLTLAQGIDTRSAIDAQRRGPKGESPVAKPCARMIPLSGKVMNNG
jgi:hypothetical protein